MPACQDADVSSSEADDCVEPVVFGHLADVFSVLSFNSSHSGSSLEDCSSDTEDEQKGDDDTMATTHDKMGDVTSQLCPRCREIDFSKAWTSTKIGPEAQIVAGARLIAILCRIPIPPQCMDMESEEFLQYLIRATKCPLCILIYRLISAYPEHCPWMEKVEHLAAEKGLYAFSLRDCPHASLEQFVRIKLGIEDGASEDILLLSIVPTSPQNVHVDPQAACERVLGSGYLLCYNRHLAPEQTRKLSSIFVPRVIETKVNFQTIRSWIAHCLNHHGDACNRIPVEGKLNTHVAIPSSKSFHLIDCESRTLVSATVGLKYTALSYVWERGPRSLAQSHHRGFWVGDEIPANLLSPAVEDGLRATQELGFRYFWVDKICIDPTSQQDKEEQIGMMRSIYQWAELTPVSPCYDESEYLPGVGNSRHQTHGIRTGDFTLLERPMHPGFALILSIWRTRGWTLQEMPSRRTLYFLEGQALFICNRSIYGDLFGDPKDIQSEKGDGNGLDQFLGPDKILAPRMEFARGLRFHEYDRPLGCRGIFGCICQPGTYISFATLWDVLYHYTWRELTDDADTLRAVEGCLTLASGFQHPIHFVLGIGFPKALQHNECHDYDIRSYFTAGLTWFHESGGLSRHRGPSWTWASWRVTDQSSYSWPGQLLHPIDFFEGRLRIQTKEEQMGSWDEPECRPGRFFSTFLDSIKFEISNSLVIKWKGNTHQKLLAEYLTGTTVFRLVDILAISNQDRCSVKALLVVAPVSVPDACRITVTSPEHVTLSVGGYALAHHRRVGVEMDVQDTCILPIIPRLNSGDLIFILMGAATIPYFMKRGVTMRWLQPNSKPLFVMVAERAEAQEHNERSGTGCYMYQRVTMLVFAVPEEHSLDDIYGNCRARYEKLRLI